MANGWGRGNPGGGGDPGGGWGIGGAPKGPNEHGNYLWPNGVPGGNRTDPTGHWGTDWAEAVDPYANTDDPYAQNMLGAYAQELGYAQGVARGGSAGRDQLQRGIRQGQAALGAQAGAMGANPMARRAASYGGAQMQATGYADDRVLGAQENAARQQMVMNALAQRAAYEQMMRDDATRRMQAQMQLQQQQNATEAEAYKAAKEDEAHDDAAV